MAVETGLAVLSGVVSKVAELFVDPIKQKMCYVFKYEKNMEQLKKKVDDLTNARERVERPVEVAKRRGEEIYKDIEKWLISVNEFTETVAKPIIDDEDKAKKLCFKGVCPNLIFRYSFSKKAANAVEDVVNLLREAESQRFAAVSYRPVLQRTKSVYIRDYQDFDSRMPIFQDIMLTLNDGDFNMIGVYGMGGVGKTTLVKKVASQAKEDDLFDVVVLAEVSQIPNIKEIQGQIADQLGLDFHEESLAGRATRLHDRLKKEERVLVILDNIWVQLDLDAIGISFGNDKKGTITQEVDQERKNQRQCKMLLTSRNLDVLRNDMNTQKNFLIKTLSYEETDGLFWKIVGDPAEKLNLSTISVEIIQKCAGLPIAVTAIANALKNRSLSHWKNALEQLRKCNLRNFGGRDANMHSVIELSYNFLYSEEAKSLLLLCSLHNVSCNVSIEDLLYYSMGLGLLQDVYTLVEGRNRLHTLIDNLKASCLLLDGNTSETVKMHEVIHFVAISIASTDELMFNIQDVTELKEKLEEKLPKETIAISLPYKDIFVLPERLEYPKLKLLLLYMKNCSLQIPDAFFDGVKELNVLNLTSVRLVSLPSSLRWLTNLQTLCLDRCRFEDVSIIGELKKLKILTFRFSKIEKLPREIGQLTRLMSLNLRSCSKLRVIAPNVLSSLTRLEELRLGNSFIGWEVEGRSNASLAELKQLSRLTTLGIHILDAQIIPHDLLFEKLEDYQIFIGDVWDWSGKIKTSRTLKLKLNNSNYLGNGVKILLNRSEELYLDELNGIKNVVDELNREGFPQLKHLHVQNAHEIQYIINSIGWGLCNVFPKLESLNLLNLINLEKICHGKLATVSFSQLRIMKIRNCDRLKHLLTFSMAKNLLQLQEIEVINCKKLEEIVFQESEELQAYQNERISRIEFSQLRTLRLQRLPLLTSFGFNLVTPDTGSHEIVAAPDAGSREIVAEDEPIGGFMIPFSQKVLLPSLEKLELSSINIECIWLDQLPITSSCCRTLTSLTLKECSGNLKYLFSYSVIQSLVELQKLGIYNCKSIEEIINTEELRGEETISMKVFPKLINLQLKGLPKLIRFGSGNSVEIPSLTKLFIKDCRNLKTFFSTSTSADTHPLIGEKVVLPKHLPELTSFCNFVGHLIELPSLARLWIANCPKMHKFVSNSPCADASKDEQMNSENLHSHIQPFFDEKVRLPSLSFLHIGEMRNMRKIWHHQLASDSFSKLETFWVNDCNNLLNVFPSNMIGRLQKLEVLSVLRCNSVEEIFEELNISSCTMEGIVTKEEDIEAVPKFVFPQLTKLQLSNLPRLRCFYPRLYISMWPVLRILNMLGCKKVERLTSQYRSLLQTHWTSPHENSQQPFFIFDQVAFPNLENLSLEWNCIVKEMLSGNFSNYSCKIKVLMSRLPTNKETTVSPCCFLYTLPNLEELCVTHGFLNEIFTCEGYGCKEQHVEAPSKLRHLKLARTEDLSHRWEENSLLYKVFQNVTTLEVSLLGNFNKLVSSFVSFQNLTTLEVVNCDELLNLVAESTAKSLVQLTSMKIVKCKMMQNIITQDRNEVEDQIIFKQLNYLELHCLPSMTSFYSGNSTIEFPSLLKVVVRQCLNMKIFSQGVLSTPRLHELQITEADDDGCWEGSLNMTIQKLFKDMVLLRGLKHLRLSEFPSLKEMWHDQLPVSYLCDLESLEVDEFTNISSVISGNLLRCLNNLKKLDVRYCESLEEVFDLEELNADENLVVLSQLSEFNLVDLPRLRNIWKTTYPQVLGFRNLKLMQVDSCSSLKYVFTPSLASGLVQLQELEIINCAMIEEIITTTEGEKEAAIGSGIVDRISNTPFRKLKVLCLQDLPQLRRFCTYSGNLIKLSSLSELFIENCPNMETFIYNSPRGDLPIVKESTEINSEENLHTGIQPLFDEKVALPNLKDLTVHKMDKLRKIWHNQLPSNSFNNLEIFEVFKCNKVLNVFPSNMLGRLRNLENLKILECDSIEEIFEFQASSCKKSQPMTATRLRELMLFKLPNLKHVWNMDSPTLLSFQNLLSIKVEGCHSLKSVFPTSIARGLLLLQKLSVGQCSMVEEIVAKEEEQVDRVPRFVLPQLTSLRLSELSRLKSFYPESCISEWPVLKLLEVWKCDRVEIFASDFLCLQENSGESQNKISIRQPMFLVDKVAFPSLEVLNLEWDFLVKEILHGKFSEYSWNLKVLNLSEYRYKTAICPSCLLSTLSNLEKLVVTYSCFKKTFLCQGPGCQEKHAQIPSKLRHLKLFKLFDSRPLWKGNSQSAKAFQNVETLQLLECRYIKTLVPSSVSFHNLKILKVLKCNKLLNLVALSEAKSLVQLTKLSISECKVITEVIRHGGNEAEDLIVFKNLKFLVLHCLPSLTSFYSVNCTIEFPSLQHVVVNQCPNMKIFSEGVLSAPKLRRIQINKVKDEIENEPQDEFEDETEDESEDESECKTEGQWHWEGNFNDTIKQLYAESIDEEE